MTDKLYALRFQDVSEDPELIYELFAALELDYSSYEDKEGDASCFLIYAETPAAYAEARSRFDDAVAEWRGFGLAIADAEEITILKEEWSESWKKYFKIINIAENLTIKPSWLEYSPRPGEAVVELDPGMSFGTGQHATTSYCLSAVARFANDPEVKSLLDAGTGSGILAIAGALLGYAPIDAFDYDPEAVVVTRENIERNALPSGAINLMVADVTTFTGCSGGYDLALVNILGHILVANPTHIVSLVRPGGYLALAGILTGEFDALAAEFTSRGCAELERRTEKEWTSGLFRREK